MILRTLTKKYGGDCHTEKEDCKPDCSLKESFFKTAFCTIDVTLAAKCTSQTRSLILQENSGYKEDGENNFNDLEYV